MDRSARGALEGRRPRESGLQQTRLPAAIRALHEGAFRCPPRVGGARYAAGVIHIGVLGAGAIGGYLGARLLSAGFPVVLVGRAAVAEDVAAHGIHLTDYRGLDRHLSPSEIRIDTAAAALAPCDVVLVTVKSGATDAAARELAPVLKPGAIAVSFQNGVSNPGVLRRVLGDRVIAGMVPFNVVQRPGGAFHQGTSGELVIERTGIKAAADLLDALHRAGLPARADGDMRGVAWGKLVLNLNNPINALAGVPLREELSARGYRRILAASMSEALDALRRAGVRPRLDLPIPPAALPWALRLPDRVFLRVAGAMIRIDPAARSSMWDDLERRRATEIDALSGEVLRLAAEVGAKAEVNAAIAALVREAERAGQGSPRLDARTLARRVGLD